MTIGEHTSKVGDSAKHVYDISTKSLKKTVVNGLAGIALSTALLSPAYAFCNDVGLDDHTKGFSIENMVESSGKSCFPSAYSYGSGSDSGFGYLVGCGDDLESNVINSQKGLVAKKGRDGKSCYDGTLYLHGAKSDEDNAKQDKSNFSNFPNGKCEAANIRYDHLKSIDGNARLFIEEWKSLDPKPSEIFAHSFSNELLARVYEIADDKNMFKDTTLAQIARVQSSKKALGASGYVKQAAMGVFSFFGGTDYSHIASAMDPEGEITRSHMEGRGKFLNAFESVYIVEAKGDPHRANDSIPEHEEGAIVIDTGEGNPHVDILRSPKMIGLADELRNGNRRLLGSTFSP